MLSLKPVEGNPSLPLVFDGNPGILWVVAAALQSLPLPCTAFTLLCLCRCPFYPYKNTSYIGSGSTLMTLVFKGLNPHLTLKVEQE